MQKIREDNQDPANPPLIVHVIDIVDFPLSFVPFEVPPNSKVIFVLNRADAFCPRSAAMGRLLPYFENNIATALRDAGMTIKNYRIHATSAKRGWGTKELLSRIFQIRNAQSNVYFIGISLVQLI
jgi:hypothetical protein